MQALDIEQAIDTVAQAADAAEQAMEGGHAPAALRQLLHDAQARAREARQACAASQQVGDQGLLHGLVQQLERTADLALEACRQAGQVHPPVLQAVQRLHAQASRLKHELAG